MQAALLDRFVLPPPSSGPEVLPHRNGARAWRASDAGVKPIVQGVVRYLLLCNEVPYITPSPVGERVVLEQARAFFFGSIHQINAGARA